MLLVVQDTTRSGQAGQLMAYVTSVILIQTSIRSLFQGLAKLYDDSLHLANLIEFLDIRVAAPRPAVTAFPGLLRKGIEFRDVSLIFARLADLAGRSTTLLIARRFSTVRRRRRPHRRHRPGTHRGRGRPRRADGGRRRLRAALPAAGGRLPGRTWWRTSLVGGPPGPQDRRGTAATAGPHGPGIPRTGSEHATC
ncbi:hypothetical protein ACIBQX_36910 [Nonomuraea sp. NPDC049714]|uniref:hypothetical protein n=1 Tax=Nonomuraea sp. NPDC049714 TaxID=3364357 RepID=UPI0037980C6E